MAIKRIIRKPKAPGNSFSIIQTDEGTSPTASSSADTLTFTSSDGTVVIEGDAGTDTIDFKVNPDFNNAAGSNKQIQFNDSGEFGAISDFTFDKTTKSLNIQTTYQQLPFHAYSGTGAQINNVVTGSVSLVDEALDASPTGSITAVQEFPAPSGSSTGANAGNVGFTATGQVIDYQIRKVIQATDGVYYQSQYFDSTNYTDGLIDNSDFTVQVYFFGPSANQTHWLIERQIDSAGFSPIALVPYGDTSYEDTNSGSVSTPSGWPTFYQLSYTDPTPPSGDSAQEINIGFGNLTENGTLYEWEIRSAANVSSVYYCEQSGLTGNSFNDAYAANSFDLQIDWTPGTGDDQVIRIRENGGSYHYHFVGSMTGQFIYTGQGNDTVAETAWTTDIASVSISYAFKCYGKTTSPSGGIVYNPSADTYLGTISTPNVGCIFVHTLTSFPAGGGKILADYNAGVAYGKNVSSGTFIDAGYNTWADGTTVTPNHYGFTGTAQNRDYRIYGYDNVQGIYSPIPLTVSVTASSGYKHVSGSFTYPSGVTRAKILRQVNGGGYTSAREFTSPTTTFVDDDLQVWGASTTVTPTAAVPSTSRFDLSRPLISQATDNVQVVDVTGSGTRYPSIVFAVAANQNSAASSLLARIGSNSATGHFLIGSSRTIGYSNNSMTTESWRLGDTVDFNLLKNSSTHTTIWAANVSNPMMYAYSAGDSNRGTVYFGQSNTSFGSTSKVVIAPPAGGTVALHIRRTSGATGDAILIDEAGSFRAGWNSTGRMYLNAASYSTTTWLSIGGISSGSQIRLASGTGNGSVEGDIWNSSTQKNLVAFIDGVLQYDSRTLFTQTSSVTVANTTTETAITGSGIGTLVLPANFFVAGKTIKVLGRCYLSSVSNPTLRIRVKLGSTTILDTTASTIGNHTNGLYQIDGTITCRTTGGSGTVFGLGLCTEEGTNLDSHKMVNTSTTTINTTTSQTLSVTAQWGTASSSNTITMAVFNLDVSA